MVAERDLTLPDGRTLHIYDGGSAGDDRLAVAWLHGTPNIGAPPAPLFGASDHLGIRWVSYDRPGYGGSTPLSGRNVASAAGDVEALVDALGVERFAVFGHSSGAACALACAALLPARVVAAVSVSGLAPLGAAGLDWFGGMSPAGVASLRAAVDGRAVKQQHEAAATAEDPGFIPADMEALAGPWAWFLDVVRPAVASGPGGLIDDDLATVAPWGFDPADIEVPVLIVHGEADRVVPSSHGRWLAATVPTAQAWIRPSDGHISVLAEAPAALAWLRQYAGT